MPRAGITTDRVVEEAERLADEAGLAAVNLTRVAERLAIRVPSLYKHVASLSALHGLIEARATAELAEVMGRAAVGRSSGDAVEALTRAYRGWATKHPGRYAATLRAPDPRNAAATAASERAVAVVLAALAGYGLTGDDAIDATRAVRATVHGFVSLEAAGGFGLPLDVDRSFDRMVGALKRSLENWGS